MITKSIIIIIISLLNIVLGAVILKKNPQSKGNKFYFLLCLFGGSWGIVKGIQLVVIDVNWHDIIITKLIYIFGTLAPFAYLLFAYNFPYKLKMYSKKVFIFVYLIPLILVLLITIGFLKPKKLLSKI